MTVRPAERRWIAAPVVRRSLCFEKVRRRLPERVVRCVHVVCRRGRPRIRVVVRFAFRERFIRSVVACAVARVFACVVTGHDVDAREQRSVVVAHARRPADGFGERLVAPALARHVFEHRHVDAACGARDRDVEEAHLFGVKLVVARAPIRFAQRAERDDALIVFMQREHGAPGVGRAEGPHAGRRSALRDPSKRGWS